MTQKTRDDLKRTVIGILILTIPGFFIGRYIDHVDTTLAKQAQAIELKADRAEMIHLVEKIEITLTSLDNKLDRHELHSVQRMQNLKGDYAHAVKTREKPEGN